MSVKLDDKRQRVFSEHREASDRFIETINKLSGDEWMKSPAPEKWTPAQITEHLILTYDTMVRELSGQTGLRLRTKWWQRIILRMTILPGILKTRRLPKGAVAPKEIRPSGSLTDRPEAVKRFKDSALRFEQEMEKTLAAGGKQLTHPYFGKLAADVVVRFCAIHVEHHLRQIPGASAETAAKSARA